MKDRNQGFLRPSQAGRLRDFDNDRIQQPETLETRLGLENYSVSSPSRAQNVEDANAQIAIAARDGRLADVVSHDMAKVPFAIPLQGSKFTNVRADYNVISNYAYVRAAADVVGAWGRNDQDSVTGIAGGVGGATFTMESPSAPNVILGFVIEWSLQLLSTSAFNMQVVTENYKSMSYQPLDRNFTLRIGGDGVGSSNGGIFAFLFAQRLDANQQCGFYYPVPGITPYGGGGMMQAIVQPARVMNYLGPTLGVPGVTLLPAEDAEGPLAPPEVRITVPTALASGFGCMATPITAASPWLAAVRAALELDS